jgi:hypothetical protein
LNQSPKKHNTNIFEYRFQASKFKSFTTRKTYSLFELFGDIGGINEFFKMVMSGLVYIFSSFNLNTMVAKSMFIWRKPKGYISPFTKIRTDHNGKYNFNIYSKLPEFRWLMCL